MQTQAIIEEMTQLSAGSAPTSAISLLYWCKDDPLGPSWTTFHRVAMGLSASFADSLFSIVSGSGSIGIMEEVTHPIRPYQDITMTKQVY